MLIRVMAVLVLLTVPAIAQNAQSPFEQALAQRLSAEMNGALQCAAGLIGNQQELAKAQTRIKELEAKYEPKSDLKK